MRLQGQTLKSIGQRKAAACLYGFVGTRPRSFIAYKMRRCTGFRPSLTSGNARPTMTDIAYCSRRQAECQVRH